MASFKLQYPSRCYRCGMFFPAGTSVRWHHALGHYCRDSGACEDRLNRSKALDNRGSLCENEGPEIEKQGGSK